MRIYLHIGLHKAASDRLQAVLSDKRAQLLSRKILVPQAAGGKNHTRLFMAVTDPDHVDPLRHSRGQGPVEKQTELRETLIAALRRDIATHQPEVLILSAHQLGTQLSRPSELRRLKALLEEFSSDIRIVAHIDSQMQMLPQVYADQILEGRAAPLSRDLALLGAESWWQAARDTAPVIAPQAGLFEENQAAPFWLDFCALQRVWEEVFGRGTLRFRPYDAAMFESADFTREVLSCFDIPGQIGRAKAVRRSAPPAAAWLTRARLFNALLLQVLARGEHLLPRKLWRQMLLDMQVGGAPIAPETLSPVGQYFAEDNARLCAAQPDLPASMFELPPEGSGGQAQGWQEADPTLGFRASQYLLAFWSRIQSANAEERAAQKDSAQTPPQSRAAPPAKAPAALSPTAQRLLSAAAVQKFEALQGSSFKPHNDLGQLEEHILLPPFAEAAPTPPATGSSGTVIVGCMKNEAPYILEWIAYHRMIGVDHFLIYSNGCTDGTSEILDRLQVLGIVQHRNNDNWKGPSPQQYALNQAMKEPLIQKADWLIHIDVDEFINIRCGNGTLADLRARVPDASAVAMTWRLFGHNGVTRLADQPVIAQFDRCAPRFCPKPHTVWGFKTMVKNSGAYQKISCHRPTKLVPERATEVKWVNGSGKDITNETLERSWRSSKKTIGYDLVQLNHYALRSAESYLIKRQRGRALHVERSIGLNYWIRMDWNDHQDVTIQRNLPRLEAEMARLMQDAELKRLHDAALAWHRAKAEELHATPEFEDLYSQALEIDLTASERVAWALSLDLES
ncbi:glycosyltransferase family 2 protein [Phaeobacter sp. HF9A]|uniref:glycosyltransferase family 2 protein n=1 Tax=Phaeobacter sp. HF9A TaxID=2721561 RepID=UPI001431E1AA|nr:glycosyltransferase family 2 protein [Phaeobacter sp. HF9A]NIZ14208.1 glycosyltransferase family 2 protein [Phaeobacter sp. HF9A]